MTASIAATTSIPPTTRPNASYRPSRNPASSGTAEHVANAVMSRGAARPQEQAYRDVYLGRAGVWRGAQMRNRESERRLCPPVPALTIETSPATLCAIA